MDRRRRVGGDSEQRCRELRRWTWEAALGVRDSGVGARGAATAVSVAGGVERMRATVRWRTGASGGGDAGGGVEHGRGAQRRRRRFDLEKGEEACR